MSLARRIYVERRKVALPLIGFLAANVGVFVLAVLPLRQAVASAESTNIDTTLQLNQARLAERGANDLRSRSKQAGTDLQKFYADILPRNFATARNLVLFWSQRTASASNLALRSGEFERREVDDSRLVQVYGRIVLSGPYAGIRRFLYALETAQEFIIVENVALEQSSMTTQAGQPGANAHVIVALDVSTFYLGDPK
jgi:hypothetical protein